MPPPIDATILSLIRDDMRLTSWLLAGACLQSLLTLFLPPRVAFLPAALLLGYRFGKTALMAGGLIHDTTQDKVVRGRMTSQVPSGAVGYDKTDNESSEDFVVFIIGARSNHPFSRFGPKFMQAGNYFQEMWKEAEADRENTGYLGRSSDMLATDDETGNAIITISYWRSMAHLHEFARGPAHMAGYQWYEKATKTNPHLGFMHEVYSMPRGRWENVYRNMTPWGMGQNQYIVTSGESDQTAGRTLVNGLVPAVGHRLKPMKA